MKKIKIIFKILFVSCFVFIFFNLIGYIYALVTPKINIRSANQIFIFDNDRKIISSGYEDKYWVNIDSLNEFIIDATISVEDKNFYKHNGFDYFRIAKAMFSNITNGKIKQGASTITQQYAKNLFLDFEQTWSRKWKEMWLTYRLETNYSKNEILEGYLNTINYGHGIYGIGKASMYYFGKNVNDLNLSEISILVGIPNSPENYSPTSNMALAKERQKVVLSRMVKNGYISKKEMDSAISYDLNFVGNLEADDMSSIMYYRDAVIDELNNIEEIPNSYLETGGLKIYTSFDINAQKALDNGNIITSNIDELQSSKVMIESNNGSVIALTGGTNYNISTYNRAIYSIRQPGSLVKPFLYYKALENGLTPSSLFLSKETSFNFVDGNIYNPKNSGNIYANKDITMAAAIAYSDNIYAIKAHLFLGEEELYNILKDLGVKSNISPTPSLALGSYEFNILEIANLYSSLSNLGKKIDTHFINEVYDANDNLLYKYDVNEEKQLLDSSLVFIINEMLTGTYDVNMTSYTYPTCISMLSNLTNKYAIKSGSTDTDAWVVGFDKNIVLVSWSGYDDSRNIENSVVLNNKNSWSTSMESYFKNRESSWYDIPNNVSGVLVNPINGFLATSNSANKRVVFFLKGTEPTLYDK